MADEKSTRSRRAAGDQEQGRSGEKGPELTGEEQDEQRGAGETPAGQTIGDDAQQGSAAAGEENAGDDASTPDAFERRGWKVEQDLHGVPRVAQTPSDDEALSTRELTPDGGVVMAPQQWDHEARTFSESPGFEPNPGTVDAVNAAQGSGPPLDDAERGLRRPGVRAGRGRAGRAVR
jgi:hypothetical protein